MERLALDLVDLVAAAALMFRPAPELVSRPAVLVLLLPQPNRPFITSIDVYLAITIQRHTQVSMQLSRERERRKLSVTIIMWTKEVIFLKDCDQETSPSTEEKIELAQLNLGLKKVVFSREGDANHIHDIICKAFPILEECRGYTLMRVSENSRNLVAIEGPDGGVTVTFLKDILHQAKCTSDLSSVIFRRSD